MAASDARGEAELHPYRAPNRLLFDEALRERTRGSIARAVVLPLPNSAWCAVRIDRRFALAVDIVAPDLATARRLLVALGHDAEHAAASFRLSSLTFAHKLATATAMIGTLAAALALAALIGSPTAGPRAVVAWLIAWLIAFHVPSRVVVGAEGVRVRWLWLVRVVPTADIEAVDVRFGTLSRSTTLRVSLRLLGGGHYALPGAVVSHQHAETCAMAQRILDVIDARNGRC